MQPGTEALTKHKGDNAFSGPDGQDDRSHWKEGVEALNSLAEDHRAVILLVAVADLSYPEAAVVLDVPIGTLMSRLASGREHMQQLTEETRRPSQPA